MTSRAPWRLRSVSRAFPALLAATEVAANQAGKALDSKTCTATILTTGKSFLDCLFASWEEDRMSLKQINQSQGTYVETKEGFEPETPNAGTIFHRFNFANDPWQIIATDGTLLCVLRNINVTLAKVTNLQNQTSSYLTLRWDGDFFYSPSSSTSADLDVMCATDDGASLFISELGHLDRDCGQDILQSKRAGFDPTFFDGVQNVTIVLGRASWQKCN